jgi:hypothetical protein
MLLPAARFHGNGLVGKLEPLRVEQRAPFQFLVVLCERTAKRISLQPLHGQGERPQLGILQPDAAPNLIGHLLVVVPTFVEEEQPTHRESRSRPLLSTAFIKLVSGVPRAATVDGMLFQASLQRLPRRPGLLRRPIVDRFDRQADSALVGQGQRFVRLEHAANDRRGHLCGHGLLLQSEMWNELRWGWG